MKAHHTFSQALSEAARESGLTDQEIAQQVDICPGYFSRFMRHVGNQWAARIALFMAVTGSDEPLRWIERETARLRAERSSKP
ncbi:MAG: hypothetical protein EBR82_09760 [Caulobacteraceae bacterium]|nr:hypothetical protein [Caulobacteraceae bacterium]